MDNNLRHRSGVANHRGTDSEHYSGNHPVIRRQPSFNHVPEATLDNYYNRQDFPVPSAPPIQGLWAHEDLADRVPPGLEYLSLIDQILVHQQVEIFEVITSWQTANKYQIKNSLGQQIFLATEESSTFSRQCCGSSRGFIMHISDNMGQEVMRVSREFKCCAGLTCCASCDACALELTVECPVGQVIGYIKQEFGCLDYNFCVYDSDFRRILTISSSLLEIYCTCFHFVKDVKFAISSADDDIRIGSINKQWGGIIREAFTTADNFSVTFPIDLDVRMKALLLAAVFQLDFMFYEKNSRSKSS